MNRILFVPTNPWTDWGGSEKLWAYTAKHLLCEERAKVGVLIKKWESINPALRDLLNSFQVYRYRSEHAIVHKLLAKVSGRFATSGYREQVFARTVKHVRPDLVVISQGANFDGLQWMECCRRHDVPYVTISHAATESTWLPYSESQRLSVSLVSARRNFFVSRDNLRLTELQIGTRLPKCSIVANPFDVPYDIELEFPSSEPRFRLACVARFELHAKGQDVLLETLSDPKWRGRNMEVGLYGSGTDRLLIERLVELFDLQKSVGFMGFVPPVEIWQRNHALILPSRFEGLPIALVEAMLCGRFGIVTKVSGNAEVVEDNVTGFVAEAPRAEYLDAALERAWARRDQWNTIGQNAKSSIKSKIPPDPIRDFAARLFAEI